MAKNKSKKNSKGMKNLAALAAKLMMSKGTKKAKQKRGRITGASMGPVAAITTAPVAIGNSVRGSKSIVRPIPKGVSVRGRDFMFTPIGTGSITTWTMAGGVPLATAAFADSTIRQYMQMYQKYRWRRCMVHYITSSPTSSTGDVMFYHGKNRDSVFLSQTSSYLLPFVISDPDTVIGPQWTNHSANLSVQGTWKSTDYGMQASVNDYADGEVFLLSKTSSTDSPGYVLFDYEIEFAEMQITPRLLSLPIPRIQYSQLNVGHVVGDAFSATAGNPAAFYINGSNISGSSSALPSGATNGDMYKIVLDVTNSIPASWTKSSGTQPTISNLLQVDQGPFGGETTDFTLVDGMTLYASLGTTTGGTQTLTFYPNVDSVYTNSNYIQWGISAGSLVVNLQIWMSYVGSLSTTNVSPNY